jgi:hypothetical protein
MSKFQFSVPWEKRISIGGIISKIPKRDKWKKLLNRRTKKGFVFIFIFITLIFITIFNIDLNAELILWLIMIGLFLLSFAVEEDLPDMLASLFFGIVILGLLFILVCWIFQSNLPFVSVEMKDSTVITMFTVVLAIATILNYSNHKKSMGLSRLPNLHLGFNGDLNIDIENVGKFDARGISIELELNQKKKTKLFKERVVNNLQEMFCIEENSVHFLGVGDSVSIPVSGFIKKRFNIKDLQDNMSGEFSYDIGERESLEFFVNVKLKYRSDTYFKNPLPVFRRFFVKISNGYAEIKEDHADFRLKTSHFG